MFTSVKPHIIRHRYVNRNTYPQLAKLQMENLRETRLSRDTEENSNNTHNKQDDNRSVKHTMLCAADRCGSKYDMIRRNITSVFIEA